MPDITQILRARQRRQEKYDTTSIRRSGLGCAMLISILTSITFVAITILFASLGRDLPSIENIPLLLLPPDGLLLKPTRFYDRDGQHILVELENPHIEERQYIPIDGSEISLPEELIQATVATLDPSFWTHPGIDPFDRQAATRPTITQRLAQDLLLWDEEAGLRRDLRGRILAIQITYQYGRQQVLEWYLNSAYYGNRVYGASSAAEVYFAKNVADLSLAEAAILAAVADSPTINPFDAPDVVSERGSAVMDVMYAQELISKNEVNVAKDETPVFREKPKSDDNIAPAFINLVWEQLASLIPFQRLERGGFEVITTLDFDLQYQAGCTTEIYLSQIEGTASSNDDCSAARLLPAQTLTPHGADQNLVSNTVILDPLNGQILAMVGETTPGLDPAHLPGHAPGSLLTPFVYLTAFTRGFNPASLLWDIPTLFSEEINLISNPGEEFLGPIRLRQALANDYLIPALATMNQIGAENIWRTVDQFNISWSAQNSASTQTLECPDCQYLLSGGEVTLLEMTQAYGILSNQGNFVGLVNANQDKAVLDSVTILRVSDTHGEEWLANQVPDVQAVTSTQLAYLMNHILSDESARWESLGHPNPLEIGRPVAAKIGQTTSKEDSWTIGYTPQLVVGVWIGKADSLESGEMNPKSAAALWHAIMQYSTRDLPADIWQAPLGINTLTVCDPSGMLPSADCPAVVSEIFLSGHEPTQVDTLYRKYQINRETGRLATVFTPLELIEEQVFMLVPPEASQWAQQVGLETPPETYDVIYTPDPSLQAQITSPQIFSNLKGEVNIEGSAFGEDFVSYRLQVGKGLNPQSWLAISEDITSPIIEGLLTAWDTTQLDGLYAVKLIVVRADQKVETTTIQVTVDNQPPEVAIAYPEANQIFEFQQGVPITFQIQVADNLGLELVEYILDDIVIDTQSQPPFALPWLPTLGEHTLSIRVKDLAGNENTQSLGFYIREPKH
jgi:membrane carboxypeptidase/penicillin-binding protein